MSCATPYLTLYPHPHLQLVSTDVLVCDCSHSSPDLRRRINWPIPRVEEVQDGGWPSLDMKQDSGGGGWEDEPRMGLPSGCRRMQTSGSGSATAWLENRKTASCTEREPTEVAFLSESVPLIWESGRGPPMGAMLLLGHLLSVLHSPLPVRLHDWNPRNLPSLL